MISGSYPKAASLFVCWLAAAGALIHFPLYTQSVPVQPSGSSAVVAKKRLSAEELRRVSELSKRIDELCAADKFTEAIVKAREIVAIRQKALGNDHWRTEDARLRVEDLQRTAMLRKHAWRWPH
jgi:hypothetical protein